MESNTITLDAIQQQVPSYKWRNPGANACLMQAAFKNGGRLNPADVKACIDDLLNSPTGTPLEDDHKKYLFDLIIIFHREFLTQIMGVNIESIGKHLGMEDIDRNVFLGLLHSRGIGTVKGYQFSVYHEIVALVVDYRAMNRGRP